MPTNTAAWIRHKHAKLEVGPATYPRPAAGQILVRNHAVAVNPVDWIIQVEGSLLFGWLKYPAVLGSDVAGEVVEIGPQVTRFQIGDRVFGHAVGTDKDTNDPAQGAFQSYSVLLERMTAPIPKSMPYENAAVLPLAVSSASSGLFQSDNLGLQLPSANPAATGQTVLVWGGSTSVGCNAIQLAVAAGYDVITTASPRNFEFVTALGASQVFDYHSATVEADIMEAFTGRTLAGAISFGATGAPSCVRILGRLPGNRFLSIATPPVSFAGLATGGWPEKLRVTVRLISSNIALQFRSRSRRIRIKYIAGTSLKNNEVSTAIYRDYLPDALSEGRYVAAPNPTVVGNDLSDIQRAMDILLAGVSASKIVVTLP
ncbi:zinc-binding alcohol dehydrogenase family protein [Nakamurella antarctica]|uniref:Zinc-binding alcohol dehydrogenase family protein n=1 Tax=Nakamurella antarctica TaxID=1902245 RepID=A0A3G8ZJJ3_9ACTN|nr:zinc-binding alcohol dehydrogenase family protein [Nakamurella antarctica]AZI56947.1 zinc-binding alcohol dehydrogenase family protein [Nakamurella antarctica]